MKLTNSMHLKIGAACLSFGGNFGLFLGQVQSPEPSRNVHQTLAPPSLQNEWMLEDHPFLMDRTQFLWKQMDFHVNWNGNIRSLLHYSFEMKYHVNSSVIKVTWFSLLLEKTLKWSWCSSRVTFTMKMAITAQSCHGGCQPTPPKVPPSEIRHYWELIKHWFPLKRPAIKPLFPEGISWRTPFSDVFGRSAEVRTQCTCNFAAGVWGSGSISQKNWRQTHLHCWWFRNPQKPPAHKCPTDSLFRNERKVVIKFQGPSFFSAYPHEN